MDKQDVVTIKWTMFDGEEGLDADPENPLSASLSKLFSKRSDLDFRLSMLFFNAGSMGRRWLGVLVLTKGKRLLFFPATSYKTDRIEAYKGEIRRWRQEFKFDHISLECDQQSWHMTSPESVDHLPKRKKKSPKTLDLGNDRNLWFGFSVQSPLLLKKLYRETLVTFGTPEKDAERRLAEFNKARSGMEFPMMSINGKIDEYDKNKSFLHFSFIVGKTGFQPYTSGELGFPHGGPYVQSYEFGPMQLPSKSFVVEMSEDTSVQIVCNIVPGKLKMPFLITGQEANNCALDSYSAVPFGLAP